MKKILSLILTLSMVLSCISAVSAADGVINITIDGDAKIFDVMPVIENSITLVPMRGVFEALGAEITWDEATQTVTAAKDNKTVVIQIGSNAAKVNEEEVTLDAPAKVISDRTMVPARFVSDALGYSVNWNDTTKTVIITSGKNILDGKKVIFIGDSNIYWSRTVEARPREEFTQPERTNDKGVFYQLCKAKGAEVSVTNWTFGSHGLRHFFRTDCTVKGGCYGVNHEELLTDRFFDYVFIGLTRGAIDEENMLEYFEYITNLFREANPDVKFVALAPATIYGLNDTGVIRQGTIDNLKTVEEKFGVIIADWGRIVRDIIDGTVSVPMATQSYNRNTFIITKDNKHPNLLAGYITALMAYCAVTGESAEGQPYDFYNDTSLNKSFNIPDYMNYYYINGGVDETTADEIFASPSDMRGLQQLLDQYLKTKNYLLD